jgi:hypothetical protein
MGIPVGMLGHRAMQRQIVFRYFDDALLVLSALVHVEPLDDGQPVDVPLVATMHTVEIHGLQAGGDRAAVTRADLAVVEFTDRRDFGGRPGEEGFVGDVDLVAGDALSITFSRFPPPAG